MGVIVFFLVNIFGIIGLVASISGIIYHELQRYHPEYLLVILGFILCFAILWVMALTWGIIKNKMTIGYTDSFTVSYKIGHLNQKEIANFIKSINDINKLKLFTLNKGFFSLKETALHISKKNTVEILDQKGSSPQFIVLMLLVILIFPIFSTWDEVGVMTIRLAIFFLLAYILSIKFTIAVRTLGGHKLSLGRYSYHEIEQRLVREEDTMDQSIEKYLFNNSVDEHKSKNILSKTPIVGKLLVPIGACLVFLGFLINFFRLELLMVIIAIFTLFATGAYYYYRVKRKSKLIQRSMIVSAAFGLFLSSFLTYQVPFINGLVVLLGHILISYSVYMIVEPKLIPAGFDRKIKRIFSNPSVRKLLVPIGAGFAIFGLTLFYEYGSFHLFINPFLKPWLINMNLLLTIIATIFYYYFKSNRQLKFVKKMMIISSVIGLFFAFLSLFLFQISIFNRLIVILGLSAIALGGYLFEDESNEDSFMISKIE